MNERAGATRHAAASAARRRGAFPSRGSRVGVHAVALLGALLAGSVGAQEGGPLGDPPTRIDTEKASGLVPAERPSDGREVAVLNVRLSYQAGVLERAELVSSKRIVSFAPKVFARQGGDWEVIIRGRGEPRTFFVFDPGRQEAETGKPDQPYQWVGGNGVVDWPLVVPLYADGKSLGAESIVVRDRLTRQAYLEAAL